MTSCLLLGACASIAPTVGERDLDNAAFLPAANIEVRIPSLSNCANERDPDLRINTSEPIAVIVHGCFSSQGQFRSLADVFALHGQQTVCFDYDDRESLEVSSAQLVSAVQALAGIMDEPRIEIIGHSQGGLVARRALIEERADRLDASGVDIRLTTISAPFGGIQAAAHCGSKVLAWLSLGLIKPVCKLITGSKYSEIPPSSSFIRKPGQLLPAVSRHLNILTDETDSCRRYNEPGTCAEDDYVFSLQEQRQTAIASDAQLRSVTVKSGHVAIVGDVDTAPTKLIDVLQQEGVLQAPPAVFAEQFAHRVARIYR